MEYQVHKRTETGLFSKRATTPVWVASIKEHWPTIIGEYPTEHEAIEACAAHAAEEVRVQLQKDLGHWPD